MVDCKFQASNHVQLHVAEGPGTVVLASRYSPSGPSSHLEDLHKGVESKGRLIRADGTRLAAKMYLLHDRLGKNPGESVRIWMTMTADAASKPGPPGAPLALIVAELCIDRALFCVQFLRRRRLCLDGLRYGSLDRCLAAGDRRLIYQQACQLLEDADQKPGI